MVSLLVDQNALGHGIGARLLRAAETAALELGCVDMELTSARGRAAAHAFYERMGYQDHCENAARFLRLIPP